MSGAAMTEGNRFASLGPMLLARKGTAKPAMRAQLGQDSRMAELSDELDELASSQDALGWNDIGDDAPENASVNSVVNLPIANKRQPITPAKPAAGARAKGKRAAFTLRLDAERHLKMRLASTMHNCSAQALVTQALDAFLEQHPELDTLAAQMRHTQKS